MQKSLKYISLTFFVLFFIVLVFSQYFNVFALEIPHSKYPTLPNGSSVDTSGLAHYLKYIFELGLFIGFTAVFFSFVYAGILFAMSGAITTMRSEARDRVSGAVSGLLILGLLYLILGTINTDLQTFNFDILPPAPTAPIANPPSPGVYFYNSGNCTGESNPDTTSISGLGPDLTNKIRSSKIVPDTISDNYYVSVLYSEMDYWGKCQYVDPNTDCSGAGPYGASASVHVFDFQPRGNGVILYRKAFMNRQGGFLFISNSEIENAGSDNIYTRPLKDMKFTGYSSQYNNIDDCTVPKNEQNCKKYNSAGDCEERECPSPFDDGITSIGIDGSYAVVLIYSEHPEQPNSEFEFCQEFPKESDINKKGPNQIKWDQIRNNGKNPNKIMIFPIKDNIRN